MEPRGCVSDVSLSMKKRDTVHMLGWRDASSAEFEYTGLVRFPDGHLITPLMIGPGVV